MRRSFRTGYLTSSWNQGAALAFVVLFAALCVAPVAVLIGGWDGLEAALVAAGLCLLGAEVGLGLCLPLRRPARLWVASVAAMVPRLGIPLGLGTILHLCCGRLADAGLLYYLVVFYPVTLGFETVLIVLGNAPSCGPGPAPNKAASP